MTDPGQDKSDQVKEKPCSWGSHKVDQRTLSKFFKLPGNSKYSAFVTHWWPNLKSDKDAQLCKPCITLLKATYDKVCFLKQHITET